MSIRDNVPGKIPPSSVAAMAAGLARMGSPGLNVVVTEEFVATVRDMASDGDYHDDRNGGSVAARTVTAAGGRSVVVANWVTLSELTDAEVERVVERVVAHEVGHASIASRGEDRGSTSAHAFPTHYWNFQLAYGAAVAVDEFRCEAAVYATGYPTGRGQEDEGLAEDLFGLNVQLLGADNEYQSHLDVACLRDDVLKTVVFHLRYMGTVVAGHLHYDSVDPSRLNRFARANWETLVAPTWDQFVDLYATFPDAFTSWSNPASADAAVATVRGGPNRALRVRGDGGLLLDTDDLQGSAGPPRPGERRGGPARPRWVIGRRAASRL